MTHATHHTHATPSNSSQHIQVSFLQGDALAADVLARGDVVVCVGLFGYLRLAGHDASSCYFRDN